MFFLRLRYIIVLCVFLLTSCASTETISTVTPFVESAATLLPITPTPEQCAFVEAHQSLTDLSAQVDQAIKNLQPEASGRAEAYGENCVFASSSQSTFTAMETDFYFSINVKSLKDDKELGTWIINAMKIVEALPPASLAGPQAGFVELTFNTTDNQKILRVPISQYNQLPTDIDPSDVIPTLFPNP